MPTTPPPGSEGERIPVYILAGGGSRRFGADKARAALDGAPMIVHVARALEPASSSITVVSRGADDYADLGLRTIGDVIPGKGPSGGLLTALRDAGADVDWILVSACDWKGLRGEWVSDLLAGRTKSAQAVVFRSGVIQPLLGLYHRSVEPVIARNIEAGQLMMKAILRDLRTVSVPAPRGWNQVTNVNRPDDL